MLKTKPLDEFESLILRKHENIHHLLQKKLSFTKGNPKQSNINEFIRLYVLLDQIT
jgi:hypothetical protein